mmetsp:Transcript_37447/g.83331  ORF Transcript_37447/g.83331 Transcript_37447/m.83331 type:complete len:95 (-) Transcript_37447:742-1026(-)
MTGHTWCWRALLGSPPAEHHHPLTYGLHMMMRSWYILQAFPRAPGHHGIGPLCAGRMISSTCDGPGGSSSMICIAPHSSCMHKSLVRSQECGES